MNDRPEERVVTIRKTGWVEPERVFSSISSHPGLMWLDSAMDGAMGKWSFIMSRPYATLAGSGADFIFTAGDVSLNLKGDPFDFLEKLMGRWALEDDDNLPPFTGGSAGFFGYGLARYCEPSAILTKQDGAEEGDLWLGFYDSLLAFDHVNRETLLIANLEVGQDPEPALKRLGNQLKRSSWTTHLAPERLACKARLVSDFSRDEYVSAVDRVRSYIEKGDCYQANIAQRFTTPAVIDPARLYLQLRSINPAPFSAYVDTGKAVILSASPERFIRVRNRQAQTRPIKGTRPRGATPQEDEHMAEELTNSAKERAENIMIVDLLRNDFSKVCLPDSVKAPALCRVEKFPTVIHLVSTVEGTLAPGKDALDILRRAFPGGSVTGAPKIRAMEIIDEIEHVPRGAYCGAIGYIGFNKVMDTSVVIRTIIYAGGVCKFHVGGGVTYPSNPEDEYMETMDKARAMIQVLGGQ